MGGRGPIRGEGDADADATGLLEKAKLCDRYAGEARKDRLDRIRDESRRGIVTKPRHEPIDDAAASGAPQQQRKVDRKEVDPRQRRARRALS
jgi:hypothetical protein